MPNASDYTIGWICAVQKESVAAEVFLDEEYDELDSLPVHDNNAYTLGRIGKHNVVIAVLPLGIYGLVKASNALKDMIRSFPNLRLGLMVGIGGGAPAKNDIRLGDVVVSVAGDGQGGVLQYDYGKAVQSEAFRITAHLNKPPDFVMTAVSKLATTYVKKGHRIQEAIESALNEYPRLRADYQKPPTDMDRLHRPDALHDETCVHSCGDDPSKLVSRRTRSATEDDPVIHYGLIASANSLMKDASIRDRFSTDYNVLCFDMEAAGLMDQLPFLVVRGICDYSDTHKKKQWQGYAAMTAAAYTKDLLSKIAPNQVEAEKKLSDILSDVSGAVSSIKEVVTNTQSRLEKEEYRKILEWLVPIDYGTQQTDYLRRRQPGTGQWLLESAEYRTWVEQPSKTLFCPGIAGAGKTILSSIVVDDLENRFRTDTDATTIYIYCNYKRQSEQTIEHFLSSLVKQLAQCQTSLPDHLKDLYAQHEAKRTRPSLKQLSEALDTVASKYSRLFIIIDALDECQDTDGCRAKLLSAIFDLQKKTRANVFATSRFIPDVTERFAEATIIEIRATESDIRRYLEGHISELPRLVATQPDLQDEIMTSITMAVEGMFLLAQLHLASLKGKDTRKAIRTALGSLSSGSNAYNVAYESAMERIQGQLPEQSKRAKEVLMWITCAARPLEKSELQYALAVEVDAGNAEFDEENIPEIEDLIAVCAGLVTVDEESSVIRLVHYTTQDYFTQHQSRWFPDAQLSLTNTCTTYLSYQNFANGCQTIARRPRIWDEWDEWTKLHRFYDYAAKNWASHCRQISASQGVISFLRKLGQVTTAYHMRSNARRPWVEEPEEISGLHLALYYDLADVVAILLESYDANTIDSLHRTPLSWAAEMGRIGMIRLLLQRKAETDSRDLNGRTPLYWAAKEGHIDVVRLLLQESANVHSRDNYGHTPLFWAAKEGYTDIVRLLLQEGADINTQGKRVVTPLFWAAQEGDTRVIQLLLETGEIDPNSKTIGGILLIHWAAQFGHKDMVQLLVETWNVEPDSKSAENGLTPLALAAKSGRTAIVRFLLGTGKVSISSRDNCRSRSPLSLACKHRRENVVKLFKQDGGFITVKGAAARRKRNPYAPFVSVQVARGTNTMKKDNIGCNAPIRKKETRSSGRQPGRKTWRYWRRRPLMMVGLLPQITLWNKYRPLRVELDSSSNSESSYSDDDSSGSDDESTDLDYDRSDLDDSDA